MLKCSHTHTRPLLFLSSQMVEHSLTKALFVNVTLLRQRWPHPSVICKTFTDIPGYQPINHTSSFIIIKHNLLLTVNETWPEKGGSMTRKEETSANWSNCSKNISIPNQTYNFLQHNPFNSFSQTPCFFWQIPSSILTV